MISAAVVSIFAVLGFGLALWLLRIVAISKTAIGTVMTGLSAMMDSTLDDDAKETAVRKAGLSLIITGFSTFVRFALAFTVAALPIVLADFTGLVPQKQVLALMLRLDYIVIVSVVAIAAGYLLRRLIGKKPTDSATQNPYSASDRFFHVLAFSNPAVLKAVSWIEDRFISTPDSATAPIFITSLARGGTTALLNAFHDMPGIATHTYRDMPFLTAPTLWRRLTGGQSRTVARRQRAHGDGLEIDLNSPEAFEEIIWMMFWPDKYSSNEINLWQANDENPKADTFLKHHMQKIAHLRPSNDGGADARYCSKNNSNIARLSYLKATFPDAHIVISLRRPESHAASLLRQHKNFLVQQSEDEFVRRYMQDIGHFEFGKIHKPIGFAGFLANQYDPGTPDYWLAYWIAAFEHVLSHAEGCILVKQDDLRHAPDETMAALCDQLNFSAGQMKFSDYFRSTPDIFPIDAYDLDLYTKAEKLYDALCQKALSAPRSRFA
ncbi:sulfotransferase [Amylibacter sp.]|nr:sulfotransferase [Amylibacter sp.]